MQKSHNFQFFRGFVRVGLKYFYYRRYEVAGYDEFVRPVVNRPSVMASNHQNALIDALIVAGACWPEYQPFFMTRSDVFGSFFDAVLYSWKLRPIYRAQDNIGDVAQANEAIFDEMVKELGLGDTLLIFPEGNHGRVRRLRPLKKGFARIGFQAEEARQFQLGLLLIPTGIVYYEHLQPGADVLVKFGQPLEFAQYTDQFQTNPNAALIAIRRDLTESMKSLIHHIQNEADYDVIDAVREDGALALLGQAGKSQHTLDERFLKEKEIIAELEKHAEAGGDDWAQFTSDVRAYRAELNRTGVRDKDVARPASSLMLWLKALLLVLGLPVFGLGALANLLPYWFANRTAVTKFKDDHFHSSIRFTFSLFLYPIYWLVLWAISWVVLGSFGQSLLFLGAIMGLALFALKFRRAWKSFQPAWRWNRLKSSQPAVAASLSSLRSKWWNQFQQWTGVAAPVTSQNA